MTAVRLRRIASDLFDRLAESRGNHSSITDLISSHSEKESYRREVVQHCRCSEPRRCRKPIQSPWWNAACPTEGSLPLLHSRLPKSCTCNTNTSLRCSSRRVRSHRNPRMVYHLRKQWTTRRIQWRWQVRAVGCCRCSKERLEWLRQECAAANECAWNERHAMYEIVDGHCWFVAHRDDRREEYCRWTSQVDWSGKLFWEVNFSLLESWAPHRWDRRDSRYRRKTSASQHRVYKRLRWTRPLEYWRSMEKDP